MSDAKCKEHTPRMGALKYTQSLAETRATWYLSIFSPHRRHKPKAGCWLSLFISPGACPWKESSELSPTSLLSLEVDQTACFHRVQFCLFPEVDVKPVRGRVSSERETLAHNMLKPSSTDQSPNSLPTSTNMKNLLAWVTRKSNRHEGITPQDCCTAPVHPPDQETPTLHNTRTQSTVLSPISSLVCF